MKGWGHVDKSIQIEDNRKTKPEKACVVFYTEAVNPAGENVSGGKYITVNTVEEAFLSTVDLKRRGCSNIKVFQEVQIKLQMT